MKQPPPEPPHPTARPEAIREYVGRFAAWSTKMHEEKVSKNEAVARVMLISPGHKVYALTVADDGTLSTTLVPLGSPVS